MAFTLGHTNYYGSLGPSTIPPLRGSFPLPNLGPNLEPNLEVWVAPCNTMYILTEGIDSLEAYSEKFLESFKGRLSCLGRQTTLYLVDPRFYKFDNDFRLNLKTTTKMAPKDFQELLELKLKNKYPYISSIKFCESIKDPALLEVIRTSPGSLYIDNRLEFGVGESSYGQFPDVLRNSLRNRQSPFKIRVSKLHTKNGLTFEGLASPLLERVFEMPKECSGAFYPASFGDLLNNWNCYNNQHDFQGLNMEATEDFKKLLRLCKLK